MKIHNFSKRQFLTVFNFRSFNILSPSSSQKLLFCQDQSLTSLFNILEEIATAEQFTIPRIGYFWYAYRGSNITKTTLQFNNNFNR